MKIIIKKSKMKIIIQTLAGTRLLVEVNPHEDTLDDVKIKIQAAWNVLPEQQNLWYRGQQLMADKTLASYGVVEPNMVLSLRLGSSLATRNRNLRRRPVVQLQPCAQCQVPTRNPMATPTVAVDPSSAEVEIYYDSVADEEETMATPTVAVDTSFVEVEIHYGGFTRTQWLHLGPVACMARFVMGRLLSMLQTAIKNCFSSQEYAPPFIPLQPIAPDELEALRRLRRQAMEKRMVKLAPHELERLQREGRKGKRLPKEKALARRKQKIQSAKLPSIMKAELEDGGEVDKDSGNNAVSSTRSRVDDSLLGVSVYWLKHGFLNEVLSAGLSRESTIYDMENLHHDQIGLVREKGRRVTCPIDGNSGAAYVHCLGGDADKVGRANYMLSYSWGYSIGDIVDAVWDFCCSRSLDPKRTYIWVCCLCNNQHRVAENLRNGRSIPFDEFRDIFHSRVTGIGHLLAMMSPWHDPMYVKRIWCIFELYTASNHDGGVEVTIVMPPAETENMTRSICLRGMSGLDQLYKTLGNTKVENAVASHEDDKTNIIAMVENGPGSKALNNRLNELLRRWVKSSVVAVVDQFKSCGRLPSQEATTVNGSPSLSMTEDAKAGAQLSSEELADFISNAGILFHKNGELEQALDCHGMALSAYETLAIEKKIAASYNNIGSVLLSQGHPTKAMENHVKALEKEKELFGTESLEVATSYNHVASVLLDQRRFANALDYSKKARQIHSNVATDDNLVLAASLRIEGLVYFKQGDCTAALEKSKTALSIREQSIGISHPDTAASYHDVGNVLAAIGDDMDLAAEYFQTAVAIREAVLGPQHSDTFSSYDSLERLQWPQLFDLGKEPMFS